MVVDEASGLPLEIPSFPEVRAITPDDVRTALARGLDDFRAKPSHMFLLVLIYPIVGLFAARLAGSHDVLYLVFPLISGFALIGPIAALGLYELSRRREKGLDIAWRDALNVFRSPSIGAIVTLSVVLGVIYVAWIGAAQLIHRMIFGVAVPESAGQFVTQVLTTPSGWALIIVGCGVGFAFALVVLAISAVSFPMLLDRKVSAITAMFVSAKAFAVNPTTMLLWGFIVAALLIVGSLPFFIGLAIVMPVLGHATWHLYRLVVEP